MASFTAAIGPTSSAAPYSGAVAVSGVPQADIKARVEQAAAGILTKTFNLHSWTQNDCLAKKMEVSTKRKSYMEQQIADLTRERSTNAPGKADYYDKLIGLLQKATRFVSGRIIDDALVAAAESGDVEVVKMLLAAGVSANAREGDALCCAARRGHAEVVRMLVAAGANVHVREDEALRDAALGGHTEVVRIFLAKGAESLIFIAKSVGVLERNAGPLAWAASRGYADVVKLLLAAGVNVHTDDDRALREAARRGDAQVVRMLVAAGANVHAREDEALREAALRGHTEVVRIFLPEGADALMLLAKDVHVYEQNAGPLAWAASRGCVEVVKSLLAAGADVHAGEDEALRKAVWKGHAEIVRMLIAAGANVRALRNEVLREALLRGDAQVVKMLVAAGANVRALRDEALREAASNLLNAIREGLVEKTQNCLQCCIGTVGIWKSLEKIGEALNQASSNKGQLQADVEGALNDESFFERKWLLDHYGKKQTLPKTMG